ncbi:WD repeat-containing protein YMR102C-like [Carya illinoinensis]|uniref:Uncharacterized protein n=1 Tax=Carya illinoinensis TaxID=32201 RepID=A0A8T1QMI7_CARIL|nr:WD repeat-containing protein YMR102C-like [Carya illinoinensis]KAG6655201.1 hypothetical protein CIPAW_05G199100 [Carya illinoinensis]KAG6655202.1 hypothetical protein CIPAW_05G199100 [Carya illinoinensis]
MGSLSEDEEYRFFDAQEEMASISDATSDSIEISQSSSSSFNFGAFDTCPYDIWNRSPGSVTERRSKFLDWMGLGLDGIARENSADVCSDVPDQVIDRIRESSGAVLRTSGSEDEFCSSHSSMTYQSKENFVCKDVNFGEVGLGQSVRVEECENTSGSSLSFQQLIEREAEETNNLVGSMKRTKNGWWSRLRSMACVVNSQGKADQLRPGGNEAIQRSRVQRVNVRQCRKRLKELSALYMGQDIQAHEGPILTMKFSPDGQYLASAGEDGIVRLWQVVEDERSNELDIPEIDPSCIYFTVDHLSELKALSVDREKMGKLKSLRKTSDSACVIFPPKVFRILEKPLHEFHGHSGEISDLSWSNNNHLLSSSIDKTVRLWQVGCDHCLKVFSHSNYVTSVQFNPVDDNYFMTGSIDGKVRIWAIPNCQVVGWSDIREIVTAVCYRPDGKGGIVGSLSGICRFYNISDNHLELDAQVGLHGKKRSPCKRIIGFQFFPQDSSKVMVTCADSQVRILHGYTVIGKYKGHHKAGNHISAAFTSNGKHIVSACEDSNVYLWNSSSQEDSGLLQAKKIRSCERFSTNASVAIPWRGLKCENSVNRRQSPVLDENQAETLPFSSPACFSLSQEFLLESFPKGSATWPEEKLPTSSPTAKPSILHKSQYKFLKTSCQNTSSSHAWGLVIVTAGWDGRIKSFHNYGLPVPL